MNKEEGSFLQSSHGNYVEVLRFFDIEFPFRSDTKGNFFRNNM